MNQSDPPKSFKCRTCGKSHLFGAYVAAHWNDKLIHTCDQCGARHSVFRGLVSLVKKGRANREEKS